MKAIVFERYGSPDLLKLEEVPAPVPGEDEVLIRVRAVSINDWDYGILMGTPFINRVMGGVFRPKQPILGSDVAGRIEAVGRNVRQFQPGDEVFGDLSGRWGGFAEFVCAPATSLALKPRGMTFAQAAAIPQAAMLAVQGLREGGMRAGQRLLINGAGGGVGTFAVQIARQHGVEEVTGVDSTEKLDLLRSLGFDKVIDYTREDFTRSKARYDLIFDVKTNRSPFDYARVLTPTGTYATVGGSLGRLAQFLLFWPWFRMTTRKKLRVVMLKPNRDLAYMCELFEAGKVVPVIDDLRTLAEVPEAMRYFGEARHKGKVVITVE
jgi:NADPH:quinone reductase-like Zn-dependent oxidoreductase